MTIYNYGDYIPNYSEQQAYTPHVWFDGSKQVGNDSVFEQLGVAVSLWLGDCEDDVESNETILEEILRYLNLHIIQIGLDFYIFDWDNTRINNITWTDLFTGDTYNMTNSLITVNADDYSSDGTQLSMDDVYNQIRVTCDVEKFEDVVDDLLDDDNMFSNYKAPQLYMREYCANGIGDDAVDAFTDMMNGATPDGEYGKKGASAAYIRDWFIRVMKSKNWTFKLNNVDVQSAYQYMDGEGVYYDQSRLLREMRQQLGLSGIVGFGSGDKTNSLNMSNTPHISDMKNYFMIAVNGNGANGQASLDGGANLTPFPDTNDLMNMNMEVKYEGATDGLFSPSDDNVTNYLVFSGSMILNPIVQKSGPNGYYVSIYPIPEAGCEFVWALRNTNTWGDAWNICRQGKLYHRYVPVNDQDDGGYYTTGFYKTIYYNQPAWHDPTGNYAFPFIDNKNLKKFEYKLGSKTYYGEYDNVGYVPILECELKIGNKYCVEMIEADSDGIERPHYHWYTEEQLPTYMDGGVSRKKSTFTLGFNPQNGDFIIGQKHDLYDNTPLWELGSIKGTAIPMTKADALSGKLTFRIIGFQNLIWDDGVRKHPTWFRHTTYTARSKPIMSHVSSILLESLSIKLQSDNGGVDLSNGDNDIVYMSDETDKYMKINDDTTFKINTALTADEAFDMGTEVKVGKSTVINLDSGLANYTIKNNVTNEVAKPEQHYVDSYYKMFCSPKLKCDTDVHEASKFNFFNRFKFNWMNTRTFQCLSQEYDLITDTKTLHLREI